MITLLTGENNFEITRALDHLVEQFDGDIERVDGAEVDLKQLPDLLMGATLFSAKRLVVIKGLSENKAVWGSLEEWLPRISDDVHAVLIESKPDKRTKTYKSLTKVAEVQEFPAWTERDQMKAQQWCMIEAQQLGTSLDAKSTQALVARVGVDQWQLRHAIEKLAVLDEISPEVIERVIEANPSENVFNLFDAALNGDSRRVGEMIRTLEQTDDPYMVFGLLSSQAFQLAALAVGDKPSAEVAKDIGAHPFAVSKLSRHASKLGRVGAKRVMTIFADTDASMKSTAAAPWLQIERALIKVAQ